MERARCFAEDGVIKVMGDFFFPHCDSFKTG